MASRCINALNELDVIADKILYKYSKNRLKQEIADKVRDSKSRADASAEDAQTRNRTSRKNNNSTRSSYISTTTKNSNAKFSRSKSTSHLKTSTSRLHDQRKSISSYKKPTCTSSESTAAETILNPPSEINFTPSIYGKFNPSAPTHKTGKWFNFEDGIYQGIIDSFECDKLNKKALCFQVDSKESKEVPKLLRHRLEVRIGQNGYVRNGDVHLKYDDEMEDHEENGEKKRTAPLSMEEQLNWKNTQIIEPRTPKPESCTDKGGLCETHPVIFNPDSNHNRLSNTTNISNKATLSYRLYRDKKLINDRRNLTCELKCVTSVQLEDGLSDAHRINGNPLTRTKSHDSDLMDMTNTIKNMENIYRTYSQDSERKQPLEKEIVGENEVTKVKVEHTGHQEKPSDTKSEEPEREKTKVNKKVSFKDDVEEKQVSKMNLAGKDNLDLADTRQVNYVSQLTRRPSSSKERSNIIGYQEFQEEKLRRPYTAPHSSPRTLINTSFTGKLERPPSHLQQLVPILVPTSNNDFSENETEPKNGTPELKEEVHDIRVTFNCKSAPSLRNIKPEEPIGRSLSTTSVRIKTEKYQRPQPTAMLDDSNPIELPPNIPPGQALIELRKKVRENLAKETADLQLDIQQLYIKHHSYTSS